MPSPDPLAIYAAIVSTVVFVWDVVKWRRQERLCLVGRVTANMVPAGSALTSQAQAKQYISLHVDNRGHIACEISHMGILIYDNWWKATRGRVFKAATILDPMTIWTQKHLPYKLECGGTYWGLLEQTPELERWSREKKFYVCVAHNMSNRPFKVRLASIQQ